MVPALGGLKGAESRRPLRAGCFASADVRHISRIRSLHARRRSDVIVEVTIDLEGVPWRYRLAFNQDKLQCPVVKEEKVWKEDVPILDRPDDADRGDPARLGQTHLEQLNANQAFREVATFFAQVRYLHIVPQLIREPERYARKNGVLDPYGGDFLDQLARMQKDHRRIFDSRLRRINAALRVAAPQLKQLKLEQDETGHPHLRGLYEHWRPDAGSQTEDQFSDGTLRRLGLLWSVLDGNGPLLLEEPELSLHEAVVRRLAPMMWKATRKSRRQLMVSTHSASLLSDESVAAEEVLLLEPTKEGTVVTVAGENQQIRALLKGGLPVGEAVLPRIAPAGAEQLLLGFSE